MENLAPAPRLPLTADPQKDNADAATPDRRPEITAAVTRGAARLFRHMGIATVQEFKLPNGRRVDIAGLDQKGNLVIAEVKSCELDFTGDNKWTEYLPYCDRFFFAVAETFPRDLLPTEEGLIIADGFDGAVLRDSVIRKLAPARRKALTLHFARHAALRVGDN